MLGQSLKKKGLLLKIQPISISFVSCCKQFLHTALSVNFKLYFPFHESVASAVLLKKKKKNPEWRQPNLLQTDVLSLMSQVAFVKFWAKTDPKTKSSASNNWYFSSPWKHGSIANRRNCSDELLYMMEGKSEFQDQQTLIKTASSHAGRK